MVELPGKYSVSSFAFFPANPISSIMQCFTFESTRLAHTLFGEDMRQVKLVAQGCFMPLCSAEIRPGYQESTCSRRKASRSAWKARLQKDDSGAMSASASSPWMRVSMSSGRGTSQSPAVGYLVLSKHWLAIPILGKQHRWPAGRCI